jgi:RNA polymerase sigma-70 factor, ECF subfamily
VQSELVVKARGGDREAFAALAAASLPRLLETARLILRDEDRAQDAAQDCLIQAWLDIRGLRDPALFGAWLNRLLVRQCYREATRHRHRRAVEVRLLPIDGPTTTDAQASLAARDQLDRAFRAVPIEQRAVLVLHHFLDLPDAEAAQILGIPVGTFKSRLNRAKLALRAAVESDDRREPGRQESIA